MNSRRATEKRTAKPDLPPEREIVADRLKIRYGIQSDNHNNLADIQVTP